MNKLQVADPPLPILHRLDRLQLLLEFVEKRHQSPSFGSSEETGKWSYNCKTLSSALEEVGRKGSIIERIQLMESKVLQLLSVELGESSRSSSPATTPMKPKFIKGDHLDSVQVNQEVTKEAEKDSRRKPKMKAVVAAVVRRKRIGCFPMGFSSC